LFPTFGADRRANRIDCLREMRVSLEGSMYAFKAARSTEFDGSVGIGFCKPSAPMRGSAALAGLVVLFATAAAAQSPAPPVLNVPYVCANGLTYTVTTCKPYRADQWCETVEKQNGNAVTTMDSAWSQMTGRLAGCKVAPPPTAPTAPSAPAAASAQQAFNPPYLKEFPTVDQIMAQLKGSSAQDTANRQLSAMHVFGQMIAAMAGSRVAQNQLTPDETRIITNYFNAYNSFARSAASPQDSYPAQTSFINTLFSTFSMPTVHQIWLTAQAQSQQTAANGQTPLAPTTDPGTLAARRCVELGGSMTQCMGTALSTGMQSLLGVNLSAMTSPGNGGRFIMFGTYNATAGLHFAFSDGSVDIGGCGQMVQGGHNYAILPSGSQYQIKIDNQPQPLVVTLQTDGKIAAPAVQQITGQKIVGYFVETNRKTGASTRTPQYGPDTETCKLGTLAPGPATAPDQGMIADVSSAISMMGSLFGGNPDSSAPKQFLLAPGPRLAGTYTSAGGLKIQFQDAGAVIDCGQAHVSVQYDVSNRAGTATIAVKNGNTPFSLTLQSNGTLIGAGSATINGKLMTALDGDGNPILTPTSATCTLGTLAPAK
jgi:hypothetical protein